MITIGKIPQKVNSFFQPIRSAVSAHVYACYCNLVIALCVSYGGTIQRLVERLRNCGCGKTTGVITLSSEDRLTNEAAGALVTLGTGYYKNFSVHNNNFVNLNGSSGFSIISLGSGRSLAADVQMFNNIWYSNTGNVINFPTIGSHDYNMFVDNYRIHGCSPPCIVYPGSGVYGMGSAEPHYVVSSGNPFVNLALDDYHLNTGTASGQSAIDTVLNLGSLYNRDMFGILMGTNNGWDIGAIEYSA